MATNSNKTNSNNTSKNERQTNGINSGRGSGDSGGNNDDIMSNSSVSLARYNSSQFTSILNLKSNGLNPNDAYLVSKRIKKDFGYLKLIDLSDNNLEDEGIIYISISLKMCGFLETLIVSNTLMTDYGLRMLLDSISYLPLKHLDISGNMIGSRGAEFLSKYLPYSTIEYLNISSTKLTEDVTLKGTNNKLTRFDVSSNSIKNGGAVLFTRGLTTNFCLQEIYLGNNDFGYEGTLAITDCIKYNKIIKLIDLRNNQLNYDCARMIANALSDNTTLLSLILDDNNITSYGIYEILTTINNERSNIEYLSFKNISMLKHLTLIVELIQQKRKFNCNYGTIIAHVNNATALIKTSPGDESLVKFARFLSEKRMTLIEMFKILDSSGSFSMQNQMAKAEFIRRLKLFEPRLTQKDITLIADRMSDSDIIYYNSLFQQSSKAYNNSKRLSLKKSALNEEDERLIKAVRKKNGNSSKNLAPINLNSSLNNSNQSSTNELMPKKSTNSIESDKKESIDTGKKEYIKTWLDESNKQENNKENNLTSNNNNKIVPYHKPSLRVVAEVIKVAQHKLPKKPKENNVIEREEAFKSVTPKKSPPIKAVPVEYKEEKIKDSTSIVNTTNNENNNNKSNTKPGINSNKKVLSKSVDDFPTPGQVNNNKKRNSVIERERIKINLISTINHSFSKNLTTEVNN